MSAKTTKVTIVYNTVHGYKTIDDESYRSENDPSLSRQRNREALFREGRLRAMTVCRECWETELFMVTLGKGEAHGDSRAYTKDGRPI